MVSARTRPAATLLRGTGLASLSGRRDMHRWKAPWVSVESQPLFLKWALGLSHD